MQTTFARCSIAIWWFDVTLNLGCAGARGAMMFLTQMGVRPELAKNVSAKHGATTEACVRDDPYTAMWDSEGYSFAAADQVCAYECFEYTAVSVVSSSHSIIHAKLQVVKGISDGALWLDGMC